MAQRATGFAKKPPVARHDRVGNAGHGAGDDGERQAIALKLIQLIAPYKKNGRLAFRIERMPQLARLSAGRNNGNNSWSLTLDDLEGLTYLPPQGAGAHTLSLRIIGLEDGGSTLSVIELPVTPVEAEGDDAASDEYIQQLTDELDRVKAMLAEREQELERRKQERSQPADVKNIVDAEITSARTAWKLEMDQRLAAAAKDAAANLEAQKAAWNSEHSGRIAQSEEKTQSRIIEARERWRQEAKGALVQAESAWRAEEAQRFAAAEAQWRAKLAAAEAKAPADAKAGNELQTAREQLKALQAKLTERDGLLGELRAAGERAKTAARQELDTALRNAETNWRAGEASRLAASEAQWRVKLADAETKAAAKSDNGAAVELERARKDIATLKGQLTERETAFDNAEMARRADEAGRMSVLEAQWQTKTAEAEVKAAATARAGAANEAERSRNEIAALKVQLAERDAGLEKQWQAKIAEAEVKAAATARAGAANEAERGRNEIAALKVQLSERDTVHRNAESAWRTGEATRHAANEAQWQAKLADAQKTAKPSEDTGAKIAALESQLAERDKTLSELRATGSEAEALWKLEEARRLAAAQAEWQRLAEVNAADLQARCERAEAALAAAPVRVESANEGELRELRETLDLTKEILSQREAALAEAHGNIETLTAERNRLQTNAPLDGIAEYSALFPPPLADDANAGDQAIAIERAKAGWKLEEAKRLSDAETKWRDQAALGLADAKARYEAAEATLAQLRLRSERDQSDDNGDARIREKLVALQNALTARESEVSYARLLLERHNLLPPGADLQNLARRASGGKPAQNLSTAIYGLRWVLELGLVVLLAITAYIYLPRAITLMPYDWQENIATATNNVRTMLGQAPAKGAGSKDSTTVAAAGGATVTHSANLRMKPSGKATIATTLPRGAKVEAIQSKGSWTLVKAEGGLQGWVFSSYLDLTADADDAASPEKPTSKKAAH